MARGFFARKEIDHYHCGGCRSRSEFKEPLALLWVSCECGKWFRYLTNMKEEAFDVECLECGAPVAVSWNSKKRQYETIRER